MDQQQEELPIDYYDSLRTGNIASTTQEGSSVVLVNDTIRLCQLTSLLPTTSRHESSNTGSPVRPLAFEVYREAATLVALRHFNERNTSIVPQLDDLKECNVHFTLDLRDTQFSPIQASRQLLEATQNVKQHSLETPWPVGLVGASRSAVSTSVAILAGVDEIPQVSPESTSAQLDNSDVYPYFSRTIPTNAGDAMSFVLHLESLDVEHFGVMYVLDAYGSNYFADLASAAQSRSKEHVHVEGAPYEDGDMDSIDAAILRLKDSELRYFVGIFSSENHRVVLERIYNHGLIGNEKYAWFFTDTLTDLTEPGYVLNAATESHLASAIHGSGIVSLDLANNVQLEKDLQAMFESEELLQYYVSRHAEDELFNSFDLASIPFSNSAFNGLFYDATMTLCIAACQVQTEFFSGLELRDQMRWTEFDGASGFVSFDPDTGTRGEDTVSFQIVNLVVDPGDDNGTITFSAQQSVVITSNNDTGQAEIRQLHPFVYWDNTTTPPIALPELPEEELNLVETGELVAGLTMAGIVMFLSVAWFIWTVWNRKRPVVKASQPVFLGMLCVGTLIMGSALIPSSLQEPVSERGLDIACMITPWLFSVGFVTAFSALFSKTWRLNKLFQYSKGYRRVQIGVKDVLPPFVILMAINIAILTAWTIVSPLEWTRFDISSNPDQFRRTNESYAKCYSDEDSTRYVFLPLILLVNFSALAFATYQAYRARKLPPSNYNESHYIAISLASLLESFTVAVPLFFVVQDDPSVFFITKSVLVSIVCFAILLPIFVPKYLKRNQRPQDFCKSRQVRTSMVSRSGKE